MKTYIFTEKPDKKHGYRVDVFRLKKNSPHYVTSAFFSYASTRGAIHEAFNALIDCGEIPSRFFTSSKEASPDFMGAGYYYGKVTEQYRIIEV